MAFCYQKERTPSPCLTSPPSPISHSYFLQEGFPGHSCPCLPRSPRFLKFYPRWVAQCWCMFYAPKMFIDADNIACLGSWRLLYLLCPSGSTPQPSPLCSVPQGVGLLGLHQSDSPVLWLWLGLVNGGTGVRGDGSIFVPLVPPCWPEVGRATFLYKGPPVEGPLLQPHPQPCSLRFSWP